MIFGSADNGEGYTEHVRCHSCVLFIRCEPDQLLVVVEARPWSGLSVPPERNRPVRSGRWRWLACCTPGKAPGGQSRHALRRRRMVSMMCQAERDAVGSPIRHRRWRAPAPRQLFRDRTSKCPSLAESNTLRACLVFERESHAHAGTKDFKVLSEKIYNTN